MKRVATILCILAAVAQPNRVLAEDTDLGAEAAVSKHISNHAEMLGGTESLKRRTSDPFDFDGLRAADVAAVYWISTDNDTTAFLAVFERIKNKWVLTHQVRLGGRGLRHIIGVRFAERQIHIECMEFAGHEPLSSPSLHVKLKASVKDGLLKLSRALRKE